MAEPGPVSSNSEIMIWVKTFFPRSSLSTVVVLVIGKSEALSVSSLEAVMENRTQLYVFPWQAQFPGWDTVFFFVEKNTHCISSMVPNSLLEVWAASSIAVMKGTFLLHITTQFFHSFFNCTDYFSLWVYFFLSLFLKKLLQFHHQLLYCEKWLSSSTME